MKNTKAIDFRNPALVRRAGMSALKNELGSAGAAYFIRQFGSGQGDYTAERGQYLEGITLDEIIQNVRALERGSRAKNRQISAPSPKPPKQRGSSSK